MTDQEAREDKLADQNLRKIGANLPLPATPTDQQRTQWKQGPRLHVMRGPEEAAHSAPRGGRFMRSKRYFLPAGSAVAAALILAGVFMTPSRQSVVSAATIMSNFRDAFHRGFRVTVDNVGEDGVAVDGRIAVLFQNEINISHLMEQGSQPVLQAEALCMQLNLAFDEDADELAGLKLRVAGNLAADDQWIYIQSDDPSPLVEEGNPLAYLLVGPLQNGMLLELEGLFDEDGPLGQLHSTMHDDAVSAIEEAHGGSVTLHAGVRTDTGAPQLSLGGDVDFSGGDPEDDELTSMLGSFLDGRATPEQFDLFVSHLEESAAEVSVDEVEPGLHILTARDFSGVADAGDEEWMPEMSLQIAYREGVGVEWVDVANITSRRGSVRFEFIDELTDGDRLTRQQFVEEGQTMVLNLGAIVRSLESLTGHSQRDVGDE